MHYTTIYICVGGRETKEEGKKEREVAVVEWLLY